MSAPANEPKKIGKEVIIDPELGVEIAKCSNAAHFSAIFTCITVTAAVPIILKRLKFLPSNLESRIFAGLSLGIAAAYFTASEARARCIEKAKEKHWH